MPQPFFWSRLLVLVAEALVLALALWLLGSGLLRERWLEKVRLAIHPLASRPWLGPFSIAAALVALRLALLPWHTLPEPAIHDELSLMLGAKTFALGRVTNPPHPLVDFFRTFHVQDRPTYMSIYPPAQALLLALGLLLGHAWIAVLAASAAMCAVVVWMLRAWFSPAWSWLGGLLVMVKVGLASYWTNGYWGGSLAALAAAVLIGSAGRVWRSGRARALDGLVMGLAVAVLVNRRPLEGSLTACAVAAALCWSLRAWRPLLRLALPAAAVLLLTAGAVAYYNWRVTGRPLTMPYVLAIERYGMARHDILLPAGAPREYPNPEFRHLFAEVELNYFLDRRSHPFRSLVTPLVELWGFFLGPALTLPLLMLPALWRDREFRPVIAILGAVFAVNLTETWIMPHYVAPEAPLGWILLVACLRALHRSRRTVFHHAAAASALACVGGTGLVLAADVAAGRRQDYSWERPPVAAQLAAQPGDHLVLVRYRPGHSVHHEFVYNEPDIDRARIVWARDLGEERNRAILAYYPHRRVWLLSMGHAVESLEELPRPAGAAMSQLQNVR